MPESKRSQKAMTILRVIGIVSFLLVVFCVGSYTPLDITPQPIASAILSAEIIDNSVPMLLVPAGEFTMDSNSDSDNRNSEHRLYLDAFYIDKYEVTNAHYAACVTAGVCEPPHFTKSDFRPNYYGNPKFDNYPVIYVDWTMART
jgi:formylglycine-generating enzyme required for sulfatase activity